MQQYLPLVGPSQTFSDLQGNLLIYELGSLASMCMCGKGHEIIRVWFAMPKGLLSCIVSWVVYGFNLCSTEGHAFAVDL